jgi:cytochrome c5
MTMKLTVPTIAIAAAALVLAGCALDSRSDSAADDNAVNGEAAYFEYCATCHEDGMFGAPRMGEPMDWEVRSSLWQAVLMEHAQQGYYDMPARGGRPELSDEVVSAAAEYMLENTYRDRPKD